MARRILAILIFGSTLFATEPDAATKRWWAFTQALANDKLQGRETGSIGYQEAERYVIEEFKKAGLSPAGTDGFRQPVPLHSLKLSPEASPLQLKRETGATKLVWFKQVTISIRAGLPEHVAGPLYFVGDPQHLENGKADGAVVVTLGLPRIRKPGAPAAAKLPEKAAAIITVDSLSGPEPPIWPLPYAGVVSLRGSAPAGRGASTEAPPAFRFNPESAEVLFEGSGHSFAELQKKVEAGETLPNFPLSGSWQSDLSFTQTDFASDNVLAALPGSEPSGRNEYVVLSAHLDGYGLGEARQGDSIYNGAFDDAAYVALLMDFAQTLHESGIRLKRSLLFCIVTGEEKGLLGSKFFAAHPTVPKEKLVADLNLDQLRPIFPLKTLTTLGLQDSSLGEAVRALAQAMDIKIQADPEPERNLLRRSDHFSFMQIGVPAVNFVFGYEKGSPEEKVYREWYRVRYHSPADDLQQPWVPEAAAKFNRFYTELAKAVANAPDRPRWREGSQFLTKSQ